MEAYMRKFTFASLILFMSGLAAAQQVELPGSGAAKQEKTATDAPLIITPSAVKPAAAAPIAADDFPQLEEIPVSSKPTAAAKPSAPAKSVEAVKPAVPAVKPTAAPEIRKAAAPKKKAVVHTPVPRPEPRPEGGFTVTKTHKVAAGDTLWDLSAKYYQDPFKWGRIYNANLNVVSNPDLINPKDELVIPEITESVKPEAPKAPAIGEGDTVKDAELSSSEVAQPEAVEPAPPAPAASVKTAVAELNDAPAGFDREYMSEDMPEHQKEWDSGVNVVPDSWREDGVIAARGKGDDDGMDDGLSMYGETLNISMARSGLVKKGDYLAVYMKGADAYDKGGGRLGREVQAAGMLEVLDCDGAQVRARVISAVTPISTGYVVKKK